MLRLLISLSIVLINHEIFAQKPEIEVVLRPALTSLRGNDIIEANFDTAFKLTGSVGLNFFLKGNSTISAAVMYDRKGGSKEATIRYGGSPPTSEKIVNKSNFDYLTIPVQWGKRFGERIKFQFGIGIYTSFLLNQENVVGRLNGSPDYSENNTHMFKRLDLGLVASFSAYFPLSDKLSFKVALDDYLGLLNTSSVPVSGDGTIKTNSFGLQAGLNVKLQREIKEK